MPVKLRIQLTYPVSLIVVKGAAVDNLAIYLLNSVAAHLVLHVHFSFVFDLLFEFLIILFEGGCTEIKINLETYFASTSSLISSAPVEKRDTRAHRC